LRGTWGGEPHSVVPMKKKRSPKAKGKSKLWCTRLRGCWVRESWGRETGGKHLKRILGIDGKGGDLLVGKGRNSFPRQQKEWREKEKVVGGGQRRESLQLIARGG